MERRFLRFGWRQRRRPLAALLAATALFWLAPARADEPTAEQVDQGREVYEEFCAMCHGRDLVNSGGFAFDLRTFPKADFDRFMAENPDARAEINRVAYARQSMNAAGAAATEEAKV